MSAITNHVTFRIERLHPAPRPLVWEAHARAEHLGKWFGPVGLELGVIEFGLRPGGVFRYSMKTSDGHVMYGRWLFEEIDAPVRLVYRVSFTDAAGVPVRHPGAEVWPLHIRAVATFSEEDGFTRMAMTVDPWEATPEEGATFAAGHASMAQGFGATYDQLDVYLPRM